MKLASFRILLQKTDSKDDVLVIKPSSQHNCIYDAEFRQETIGTMSYAALRASGVVSYVELFLDSVLADNNGCTCIQIDCPQFPSIILFKDSIIPYMPILRVQLSSIVENWPMEYLLS